MKVYRDVDIKRMAWGCRGGGHIPNTEKLAIIRAKIFKIWAKYSAAFTCSEVVSIFQTETKLQPNQRQNNDQNGKIVSDYFDILFCP